MTDQPGYEPLSREELNEMAGEELPERAAMSLVNANVAIPINAAVAANVLSDNAVAYADAVQQTPIDQSTGGGGEAGRRLPRPDAGRPARRPRRAGRRPALAFEVALSKHNQPVRVSAPEDPQPALTAGRGG